MKPQSIGNLKSVIEQIENEEYNNALFECYELLKVRPFHPEAILQIVDLYFRVGNDNKAKKYIKVLYHLTPRWDISIRLYNKYLSAYDFYKPNDPIFSICMIVKNEEKNLERCLRSIKQCKNYEIIIVDTGSTDNTLKIAKSHNAKIYKYKWNNDFSAARNKAMEYARGDWVLILDADEELAPNSYEKLKQDINKTNIIGYRLPLENVGSPLNGVNYVPRLFRNAPGLYFIGKIHETIYASLIVVGQQWNMDQGLGCTKILHYGYQPDQIKIKCKIRRNLELYDDALADLPDEPSIMMNYAHDLNHDGQTEKAYVIFQKIHGILEQHKTEDITPEVREQFIHNYGIFLAQENKMKELVDVMFSRTARDTGPVANVHYMADWGLLIASGLKSRFVSWNCVFKRHLMIPLRPVFRIPTWKPSIC